MQYFNDVETTNDDNFRYRLFKVNALYLYIDVTYVDYLAPNAIFYLLIF